MTMAPVSGLVAIARWLQSLKYNRIRWREQLTNFPIHGKSKMLRGVRMADDLYMSRNRTFFKIVDGRAIPMPLALVADQYALKTLMANYAQAKKDVRQQRKQSA